MKHLRLFFAAAMLLAACPGFSQQARHLGPWPFTRLKGQSFQGMDICDGYLVQLQNKGVGRIYKLEGDSFTQVGKFCLGSFDPVNHANVASFGVQKYSKKDVLPVLYVSQCQKKLYKNMKDVCFVERIADTMDTTYTVQTILYNDVNKDFGYALQWVVDTKHKMLYGYGNTINNDDPANRHRVIKFRLPKLSDGPVVVLQPEDALENYLIEEVSGFRFNPIGQGLYIRKGKLYMPTGLGKPGAPSILYVWDLKKHSMQPIDLTKDTTGELEDISYWKGRFYIGGQDGLFVMD